MKQIPFHVKDGRFEDGVHSSGDRKAMSKQSVGLFICILLENNRIVYANL